MSQLKIRAEADANFRKKVSAALFELAQNWKEFTDVSKNSQHMERMLPCDSHYKHTAILLP